MGKKIPTIDLPYFGNALYLPPPVKLIEPRSEGELDERCSVIQGIQALELWKIQLTVPRHDSAPYFRLTFIKDAWIEPCWANHIRVKLTPDDVRVDSWPYCRIILWENEHTVWVVPESLPKTYTSPAHVALELSYWVRFGASSLQVIFRVVDGHPKCVKMFDSRPIKKYRPPFGVWKGTS